MPQFARRRWLPLALAVLAAAGGAAADGVEAASPEDPSPFAGRYRFTETNLCGGYVRCEYALDWEVQVWEDGTVLGSGSGFLDGPGQALDGVLQGTLRARGSRATLTYFESIRNAPDVEPRFARSRGDAVSVESDADGNLLLVLRSDEPPHVWTRVGDADGTLPPVARIPPPRDGSAYAGEYRTSRRAAVVKPSLPFHPVDIHYYVIDWTIRISADGRVEGTGTGFVPGLGVSVDATMEGRIRKGAKRGRFRVRATYPRSVNGYVPDDDIPLRAQRDAYGNLFVEWSPGGGSEVWPRRE